MNVKRLLALVLSMLILCSFSIVAIAEEYTASNGYSYDYMVPNLNAMMDEAHKYDYVYDFADLLTDSEEADLSAQAKSDKEAYGIEINYLTYDDAYGKSEVVFTDDFYDYYITELRYGSEVDGVLISIDMDNRQVYLNTVGTANDNIDDDEIDTVLDATWDYITGEDYYNFLLETSNEVLECYSANESGVGYTGPERSIIEKVLPTTASLIVSLVILAVVLLILFAVHNKNNKAPSGQTYQTKFNVLSRNAVFMGHREEVIHDFYKQQSSSGGGGSSHMSGGGFSHGGGGRGF